MPGATGGQPPFDHRKIPESRDDIDSGDSLIGCFGLLAILILITMLVGGLDVIF